LRLKFCDRQGPHDFLPPSCAPPSAHGFLINTTLGVRFYSSTAALGLDWRMQVVCVTDCASLGSSRPHSLRGLRQHAWLWPWRRRLKNLARPLASVPCTRVGRRGPGQGSSAARPDGAFVEAFLVSTTVVGLAEIDDKTQILSLMLAARFKRPAPIILGILRHTRQSRSGRLRGRAVWRSACRAVDALDPRVIVPQCRCLGVAPRQIREQRSGNWPLMAPVYLQPTVNRETLARDVVGILRG
jgi:hypothetical protein